MRPPGSSPLFAHTGSPFPTKYKTVISKKFPPKIKKIKSDFKCTASVTRFSGYAVSLTERTYTHKGVGGEQGCGGGEVGVQGEENLGVCAYHGGRRQSGPHTCFYPRWIPVTGLPPWGDQDKGVDFGMCTCAVCERSTRNLRMCA